tara:strand:+ start:477 stop:1430 length:954 start_codon:yes stop_codon:yes gene_type:complete
MSYTLSSGNENSKIIFINSSDKTTEYDSFGSVFSYHLETPIITPTNQDCLISLHSCVVPYSFYNIRENINDRIPYRLVANDNLSFVKIPKGNYTITTLANTIKTLLDGITGGVAYTITYNRTTMKYTYDSNSQQIYFDFSAFTDTSHIEMGFGKNETTIDSGIDNLESTNVPDINGNTHQIQIRTNLSTKGCIDSISKSYSTILGSIPIDVNFGGVIFSNPSNIHKILITSKNIQDITIRITDDRGRPINLNGLDFTCAIMIDFIDGQLTNYTQESRRIVENTNFINRKPKESRGRPKKGGRPKKLKDPPVEVFGNF